MTNKKSNSVFTKLFSDPEKLLSLYNALSGNDYPLDTIMRTVNTPDITYSDEINDVCFIMPGKIVVIVEPQPIIGQNLQLHLLTHLGYIYNSSLDQKNPFMGKLINASRLEFIVLYNGIDELPVERELKICDVCRKTHMPSVGGYLGDETKIINVSQKYGNKVFWNNADLDGYEKLMSEIHQNQENGLLPEDAAAKAIQDCISNNILADFLTKNSSEIIDMFKFKMQKGQYL